MISSPIFASLNALTASRASETSSREARRIWTWRVMVSTLVLYASSRDIA